MAYMTATGRKHTFYIFASGDLRLKHCTELHGEMVSGPTSVEELERNKPRYHELALANGSRITAVCLNLAASMSEVDQQIAHLACYWVQRTSLERTVPLHRIEQLKPVLFDEAANELVLVLDLESLSLDPYSSTNHIIEICAKMVDAHYQPLMQYHTWVRTTQVIPQDHVTGLGQLAQQEQVQRESKCWGGKEGVACQVFADLRQAIPQHNQRVLLVSLAIPISTIRI